MSASSIQGWFGDMSFLNSFLLGTALFIASTLECTDGQFYLSFLMLKGKEKEDFMLLS
jgi:hypothetical protein